MSEWSRDIAKRFGEIDNERTLRDRVKMHDAGLLAHQGPALWEELCAMLDRKAAELNKEPEMKRARVMVDTNVSNEVTLRSNKLPLVKGRFDPKAYTINFTPSEEGRYKMGVNQGENRVTIFDPKGFPATVEELAQRILVDYLGV